MLKIKQMYMHIQQTHKVKEQQEFNEDMDRSYCFLMNTSFFFLFLSCSYMWSSSSSLRLIVFDNRDHPLSRTKPHTSLFLLRFSFSFSFSLRKTKGSGLFFLPVIPYVCVSLCLPCITACFTIVCGLVQCCRFLRCHFARSVPALLASSSSLSLSLSALSLRVALALVLSTFVMYVRSFLLLLLLCCYCQIFTGSDSSFHSSIVSFSLVSFLFPTHYENATGLTHDGKT